MRTIAIDWSGRAGPSQTKTIYLAEAARGELIRLENGRTRDQVVEHLLAEADRDPDLVVGLDFAFSLPQWYLGELGLASAKDLWRLVAEEALTPPMRRLGLARWLSVPEPPFWTTTEGHALLAPEQEFRRTDLEARTAGSRPKSVFQLVGAGQVGRGSLYGMPALDRLSAAGFRIWPFDSPGRPLALEIFPRLLTGPVHKRSALARCAYLDALPAATPPAARASEDAFDAAVSALAMDAARAELSSLSAMPAYRLEGAIWRAGPAYGSQ
jgi:hypothetical protein